MSASSPPNPPGSNSTESRPTGLSRPRVAGLSVACLAIAGGAWLLAPEQDAMIAAFWRIGLVMGALWLALPAGEAQVAWGIATPLIVGTALTVGLSRNSKALIVVVPLVLTIVFLTLAFRRPRRRGAWRKGKGRPGGQ